ncbi:MAG TPA: serine/threonine-protein kinase, partial [Polyangium sp.]|nr:serine/threonine-protein kinase [Polyangium sp.]
MHASSNEIGQLLLGKYRVESVLGQGGMGIVVAARHVDLGKRVAIKKLLPHAMEYPGACERFVREARSAARLEGEHIAQVHDAGTLEDGTPFILMEYLDGQDLKKVVRERGALPAGEAALYVYQACEAVAEAHAQGIAHRDLKPANMMLVHRATGAPCIKVLDFGISKELDPAARQRDLTQSGVIMCSPSYMAPEQVSHPKEVDLRSDVWALGVVLYELVTGILPFQADSGMELLALVLQKQPQRPIELIPGLSGELEAIIMKCMAKERDKRFQTAVELMRALRPFVTTDIGQPHSRRPGVSD